jgi:hypothetical protein
MNIAVRGLTPTQLEARERHLKFRESIQRKAAELAAEKMVAAMKEELAPLIEEPTPLPTQRVWFHPADCKPASISILEIQVELAKYYSISIAQLCSPRKTEPLVRQRQVGFYLSLELTESSLKQVGRKFGGKDHTTVLYGARKIGRLLREDENLAFDVAYLIEQITGTQQ